MNKLTSSDLYRYTKRTELIALISCFFSNPAFRFLFVARKCKVTRWYSPLGLILRLYYRKLRVKYGYQIPFVTSIGGGFVLSHFGNVVINNSAIIGANCTISQGVTIGRVSRGNKEGSPTIGDRVWIGPNAVVAGKIKIGNDVLIAPLTYVTNDIPDNAVVAGNPVH